MTTLKRGLLDRMPISQVCEEAGIHPNLFGGWSKRLLEIGARRRIIPLRLAQDPDDPLLAQTSPARLSTHPSQATLTSHLADAAGSMSSWHPRGSSRQRKRLSARCLLDQAQRVEIAQANADDPYHPLRQRRTMSRCSSVWGEGECAVASLRRSQDRSSRAASPSACPCRASQHPITVPVRP